MYKVHQDAKMIPIHWKSKDYQLGDETLKSISASASIDWKGNVHVPLVNIHARAAQAINIDLRGIATNTVSGRILKATKLQAYNTFEMPNTVKPETFEDVTKEEGQLKVKLPAYSLVVLTITPSN